MIDTWGERLKSVIQARRLLQSDIANAVSVSEMTVSKWVRGGGISDAKLSELADFLGVAKTWLRYGEGVISNTAWVESADGHAFVKHATNGALLANAALISEAALGMVFWTYNIKKEEWVWSANAVNFFGLGEQPKSSIREMMHAHMSEESTRLGLRLISDLKAGNIKSGWVRYTMRNRPNEAFLMVASRVSDVVVTGVAINSSGPMGKVISSWSGLKSSYDESLHLSIL